MNSKDQGGNDNFPPLPGFDAQGSEADAHKSRPNIRPDIDGEASPAIIRAGRIAAVDEPSREAELGEDRRPLPFLDEADGEGSDDESPHATTKKHSRDPMVDQMIGSYTVLEVIGQGGMGMVYKARQASLDRLVAIKVLNKALIDNDEFIKRFEREAKAMAHLHHPNIVSVIDFGVQNGMWFMVAEFVEGTNLSRVIRQQLMIAPGELVPLMVQCLSGLDYVARSGVVHRDIKPDNILIDKAGVAKIADFGLAKDFSKEETDLTAAGSAMGTPSYMSPEQCMGRPLDVRSDIYSFGVTAYYALTGEKPFTGQSSFEIMTKQREYDPPPVHQINPQVPKGLSALVLKMLAKKPGDRYQTADECRDAWLGVGQDLGFLSQVTRSGEFFFVDPNSAPAEPPPAGVSYPDQAEPFALGPMESGGLPELHAGLAAPPPPVPRKEAEPSPPSPPAPPPRGNKAQEVSSGAHQRPGPSAGGKAPRTQVESTRQPRTVSTRFAGRPMPTLAEAERMFRAGRFKQAADAYGRLAEQEEDRKQRSILRTKERDARTRHQNERGDGIGHQVQGLIEQGQYKAALRMLEGARSAGASSVIDKRFSIEILRLRGIVQRRARRRRALLILLLVLAAGYTVWYYRGQIQEMINGFIRSDLGNEGSENRSQGAGATGDPPDEAGP